MPKKKRELSTDTSLYERIAEVIEDARRKVSKAANLAMVYCYYNIGRMIVEDEQQGKLRADYGKKILQSLSKRLTERFGKVFSYPSLKRYRQFFLAYSPIPSIGSTTVSQLKSNTKVEISSTVLSQSNSQPDALPIFTLSWSHYLPCRISISISLFVCNLRKHG